ncbi:MAG: hypothetical protein DWP97_13265 [Calditrichaeota bacterium]|nr:MAG: hypothetical protein DWP97_13265 [Calditrichota bacterium]
MTHLFKSSLKSLSVLMMIALLLLSSFAFADDGKIPQRSDIDDQYKWKVEDIYPDTETWEKDFEIFKTVSANLNSLRENFPSQLLISLLS